MQPASDLLLGWVIGPEGRHFYIRQLRDVKLSALVETYDAEMVSIYGKACGWALARAHAKAGDPWTISGYLGNGAQFDDAMGKFALAYADQAEKDHAALKAAVRAGIVDMLDPRFGRAQVLRCGRLVDRASRPLLFERALLFLQLFRLLFALLLERCGCSFQHRQPVRAARYRAAGKANTQNGARNR